MISTQIYIENTEDTLLWKSFKQGDKKAFEQLYKKYFKVLGSYGFRLSQDKDLVEDAIHDVFIDLWRRKEYLSDVQNVKFYLFSAIRNQFSRNTQKDIFVADLENGEFEQLFLDGKPLLEARWPNMPRDKNGDWDFFSPDLWATVDTTGNHYGTIKDKDLMATGWNVTGAKAVLNVCHQFFTWTRIIENYTTGSDSLNYPKNLGKSIKPADETGAGLKFNDDRYYLIGKKEFLDSEEEWYYDTAKKQLYIYAKDIDNKILEVKTRNYCITSDEKANHIIIDGLTIFGSAFKFGKDLKNRSNGIIFKNNKVLYSSWTEFLLMPDDDPKVGSDKIFPTIQADNSVISNNEFAYGALHALFINGFSNLIENNVFHDFDLSSSLVYPPLLVSKNQPNYVGMGAKAVVRYNSIYNSGGISTQIGQRDNDFYLNDLFNAFRSSYGGNKDASALYTQNVYCHGTRLHHNWVHDAYAGTPPLEWGGGMGIRGDDHTTGLTVDHNMVWNIGSTGFEIKNPNNTTPEEANKVCNNTVFQHSKYNRIKSAMIVETIVSRSKNGDSNEKVEFYANVHSSIVNNLAETIYGHWFARPLEKIADYSHNATGKVVESLLENPTNFDFRPTSVATDVIDKGKVITPITTNIVGSSPDIGAYERGDITYWIPGRREIKASFPIVSDGASINANRDILMWRPAYQAVSHQVYFGINKDKLILKAKTEGEANVFILPTLEAGKQYFWRVDAVMADGSVIKGDVWNFTTIK